MAWTLPTGLFFCAIALALAVLTVAEARWPNSPRRGLLPLTTTRGDRFFISLLCAAVAHIIWIANTNAGVWIASCISGVLAWVIWRWG